MNTPASLIGAAFLHFSAPMQSEPTIRLYPVEVQSAHRGQQRGIEKIQLRVLPIPPVNWKSTVRRLGVGRARFAKHRQQRFPPDAWSDAKRENQPCEFSAQKPDFIAHLYREQFGREGPDRVRAIEEIVEAQQARKTARMMQKPLESPVGTTPTPSRRTRLLQAPTISFHDDCWQQSPPTSCVA